MKTGQMIPSLLSSTKLRYCQCFPMFIATTNDRIAKRQYNPKNVLNFIAGETITTVKIDPTR